MTDVEALQILTVPKRIGERLKWQKRKDDRPLGRDLRATIVMHLNPDYERELVLMAESYRSRSGLMVWSVAIKVSGLQPPLVCIDRHNKPHINPDQTRIDGCMIHNMV